MNERGSRLPGLAGMGVGLVSVLRFERALERFGGRLRKRLFRPAELEYARRRRAGIQSLAVRFAAKSAGRRALALCGLPGIPPHDLEVVRPPGREPTLRVHGPGAKPFRECGLRFAISLTHDADLALATVWLERIGDDVSLGP